MSPWFSEKPRQTFFEIGSNFGEIFMDIEWMGSTVVHDSFFTIGFLQYIKKFQRVMDMYIYIYIYIYIHIYIYIYTYIYINIYIYIHTCMYICACIYVHVYIYIYIYPYIFVYICIYLYSRPPTTYIWHTSYFCVLLSLVIEVYMSFWGNKWIAMNTNLHEIITQPCNVT